MLEWIFVVSGSKVSVRREAAPQAEGLGSFGSLRGIGRSIPTFAVVGRRSHDEARRGGIVGIGGVPVLEAHELFSEEHIHGAYTAATVLGEDELGFSADVVSVFVEA